nr:glycosyltransferase family 2 protein [uncultured Methanolobus sp.]
MSCFAYVRSFGRNRLNILKTLCYWSKKPLPFSIKISFILTKLIEIAAFKSGQHAFIGEVNKTNSKIFSYNDTYNSVPLDPTISVVVPVYIKDNFSMKCLLRLVEALKSQSCKIDTIILIDDCSPMSYPIPKGVCYHKLSQNSGPAIARNAGINLALDLSSDVIVFTDVDCLPECVWVENIIKSFQKNRTASIISGNTKSLDCCWFDTYHEINGTLNGRVFSDNEFLLYGPTCNIGITSEVAKKISFSNSFPTAAGEDIEFCFKALNSGFRIKFEKNVVVYHDYGYERLNICKNLMKFINQFKRYANGESVLLHKIPDYYHFFNETVEISSYEY